MNFSMRPSRVLKKLRNGEIAYCAKNNYRDPRLVELLAAYGFDCVWSCREHVPNSIEVLEQEVLAAKSRGADLLCRVPRGSYSDYIKPLELDASGIMVPHIMSAADAKQVVSFTRFPPIGRRACDGGNSDALFCNVPFTEYLKTANSERFVILQIEDPEAVNELDAIADVEGYDMLFFGPGDYSVSIGVPGQLDHPEVMRVRKLVAKTAEKYGKFAGTVGNPGNRKDLIDMGYKFINVTGTVGLLNKALREAVEALGISSFGNCASGQYGAKN